MGTTLNTESVQRGLANLGQAIARNNAILAEQQTAQARLTVRQKLNDKINEFSKRQQFDGDWGQEFRDFTAEAVNEGAKDIKDPAVLQAFQVEMQNEAEGRVNTFRDIQRKKQEESIFSNLEVSNQRAIQTAAEDPQTFLVTAQSTLFNPKTMAFTQSALQAYGGPDGARKRTQDVIDAGAGTYVGAQLDKILQDETLTWADRASAITQQGRGLLEVFDAYGLPPSQATRAKLEDSIQKAVTQAQAAAATELESGQLAALYQAEQGDVQGFSLAKYYGNGFIPSQLKAFSQREDLLPEIRAKASDMIAKYSKEIPTDAKTDDKKKNAKVALQKDVLMALTKAGATELALTDAVNKMATTGYQGITLDGGMTYAEAQQYAGGLKPLISNQDLTALAKELKMPESLQNRWAEAVGGVLNGGKSAYIKDGVLDREKATKLAASMIEGEKAEFISDILKSNSGWFGEDKTADDKEVGLFVRQMAAGAGLARFKVAPGADHPDLQPFLLPLQRMFTKGTGRTPQATRINQGDHRGQPQFLSGGVWYEATPDGKGGVTFAPVEGTENPKGRTTTKPGV